MPLTRVINDMGITLSVNNSTHLAGADANTYLSNVALSSPANNQTLVFSGANNTWYNANQTTVDNWVMCEIPSGVPNSSLTDFTTLYSFVAGTTCVYLNGIRQPRTGVDSHYSEVGTDTIRFAVAPITGDVILVDYVLDAARISVVGEIPSGSIDSVNLIYTTQYSFRTGTTLVFLNGIRQQRGAGSDYVETNNNTLTFVTAPTTGDLLFIDYLK